MVKAQSVCITKNVILRNKIHKQFMAKKIANSLKIARISIIFAFIFLIGIFIPIIIGLDGFDGGFAISFICFFLLLCSVITSIIFWRMSILEEKIKNGKNLIAHWTYSKAEWQDFTKTDLNLDKSYKNMLFYIICGFSIFFGIAFYIYDPEDGIYVTYVMLGLIVLMFFVSKYSIYSANQNNLKNQGETYISTEGVIANGQFHSWKTLGAQLENITYIDDTKPKLLEFEYSIIVRYGRQSSFVRIPVPKNEEKNVKEICEKILKSNK